MAVTFRTLGLCCAGLVLAALAWRDAAVEYWIGVDPQAAPIVIGDTPRVMLAQIDPTLLFGAAKREDAVAVMTIARAGLEHSPLDAQAVSQLSLASTVLGQDGMKTKMQLARHISRRDQISQGVLLSVAAAEGDYKTAFAQLDIASTVNPDARDALFKTFVPMLADPLARRSLSRYARRPWFFYFLSAAVEQSSDPRQVAALWIEAHPKLANDQVHLLPQLLQQLTDRGNGIEAMALATWIGGASPARLGGFAFSPDSTRPALAPLTWSFPSGEDISTTYTAGSGLAVEMAPGKRATVMQRTMQLRSGRYRLSQNVAALGGRPPKLEWQLACRTGVVLETVWRHAVPFAEEGGQQVSAPVIPPSCANQVWQLSALADEDQIPARFEVRSVYLRALD